MHALHSPRRFMRFTAHALGCGLLAVLLGSSPAHAQAWSEGPPLARARADAAAAVLGDRLYVIGGRNTAGQLLGSVERFDPSLEAWVAVEELRDERYAAAAVAFGNRIVLTGGREDGGVTADVEEYVPAEDDWESFRSLERAREGHGAVVLGGEMYVVGGADGNGTLLTSSERYDAADDDWEPFPGWTLDPARAAFGTAEAGGAAYIAGGFTLVGPTAAVQRYTPGGGTAPLAPMPTARGGLALVAADGHLYAIGGRTASGVVGTVERYDLAAGTWEPAAALGTPREGAAAAYLDGRIYVAGGFDSFGNALATVEVFAVAVASEPAPPAPALALAAAYPNPFAERTTLTVHAASPGPVSVRVYDVRGREVAVLLERVLPAGSHRVEWDGRAADGRRLGAGLYLVRVLGAGTAHTAALTLLR
jgi:hypothetical protein